MKAKNSRGVKGLARLRRHVHRALLCAGTALGLGALQGAGFMGQAWGHDNNSPQSQASIDNLQPYPDPSGDIATYNVNGRIDTRGAFFQSLGTNGRSCVTCHAVDQAMSISTPQIRERFRQTNGNDPLFAPVDGANCPSARRSDRNAHSLLLQHGLIRVGLTVAQPAQFTISVVHDPYGCALVLDPKTGGLTASVYRRPLPAANLGFLNTVMWDGRETVASLANGTTFLANLQADLAHQATDATNGHAQAAVPPTSEQVAEIVQFELGLYTAQIRDDSAGRLDGHGALGGPSNLADQEYYPGINDVLGADPEGDAFDRNSIKVFAAWAGNGASNDGDRAEARRDIAAGEQLFDTAPLTISNVRGLNDNPAIGKTLKGTCTTCHDTPNVGNHSLPLPLDIGLAHSSWPGTEPDPSIAEALAELDPPNLPVFVINGCPDPFNGGRPEAFYTSDPGKALLTGQCSDLNRLKGPVLRGLAARAPYFHNGAAANLMAAVNFYDKRFQMRLTHRQKEQLVAFLNSL